VRVKPRTRRATGARLLCPRQEGEVERVCGRFPQPEELAYGFDGEPRRVLYRVRFRQRTSGPLHVAERGFHRVEIYEHWLEPS
jgi:nitrile hydratase